MPTPIGNLGDMTYRAVEVLKTVDLIAAEDTRTSLKLLKHYDIKKKLISYHKFNERKQSDNIITLLNEGRNVAIITDAGTPGISDPAEIIVKIAIKKDIQVCCLPGSTALIPALAASGLNTDKFTFAGFLPVKKKERTKLLSDLEKLSHTIVLYESSHRIKDTIKELSGIFTERQFVIAREISKIYETYYRGTFDDISFIDDIETRGEFVILVKGKKEQELTDDEVLKLLKKHNSAKTTLTELVHTVTTLTGINRNRIYKLALKLKKKNE